MTHSHVCYILGRAGRDVARPNTNVFITSFLVFVILNIFENLLHYSIGRTSTKKKRIDSKEDESPWPDARDWLRIASIMFIFALLQGAATYILS